MSPPVMGPPSDRARYVPTAFNVGVGCLRLMAVTRNTSLPQTTGELQLRPGTSSFHAMFSVALHVSGSRASSAATPARLPRNCGQFLSADLSAVASAEVEALAELDWAAAGITETITNSTVRSPAMMWAILA